MELKQKVSTTGLRILSVLDILLKGPASKNEISDSLVKIPWIKNITKETIGLDINTLKSAGFEIENMGKSSQLPLQNQLEPDKIQINKKRALRFM